MKNTIRTLMLGDISGDPGLGALFLGLSSLIREEKADLVIANGENAAGGFGITVDNYSRMRELGVDVITSGNHIWQKEEIYSLLDQKDDLLRPVNYPSLCPGKGYTIKKKGDLTYAVINAQCRLSMYPIDDPMDAISAALREIHRKTKLVFVDLHGEETIEKEAISFFLDGKVTAVAGTHTHVQTADEKILPQGTAYITDLGMTGVLDGVIGSQPEKSLERQLTQLPVRTEPANGTGHIQGVLIEADAATGRALSIKRVTR